MARIRLIVEYKYPGEHWSKYDETSVANWATEQEIRAKKEHPYAEVRIRKAK